MTGRIIIVTGGFGTLGCVVAAAFTASGDHVARVDFAAEAPDREAALDIGGVDIADETAAREVVRHVTETLGPPTVLVNIAGGFVWQTLTEGELSSWDRMFRMNALTAAAMARACLPSFRLAPAAQIINIGAYAAHKAGQGMGPYAASKAAVHRLTESLADELIGTGITVNAVLPTIIDTPINRAQMANADVSQWLVPQSIADVVLFLASRAARAINGALLPVTRGTPD